MGNKASSSSKTSQDITNTTINQSIVDTLNENIMNVSTNTLISNANTCSSSVSQNNLCKVEVKDVAGDLNIGGTQTNSGSVDFSCINNSSSAGDMSTAMVQNLISQMQSLNGTDNAVALNSAANAAANTGSLATGSVSGNSSTDIEVSNNVTNETINYVRNLFEQNLNNNFSSETVNQCIGKTTQTNTQDASAGNIGGNVNVSCIQTNSVDQVQRCEQLAQAVNKTVGSTLSELGLSVVTESQTTTQTESTATSTASAIATGPIQEFGDLIVGAIGAIGDILGDLGSYWLYIALCIGCVVLIVGVVFIASGGSISGDSSGFSVKTQGGGWNMYGDDSSSLSDSSLSTSSSSRTSDTNFTYYNVPDSLLSDTTYGSKGIILTPNLIFTL